MKLEDKIKVWIINNPDRAYAGNRMMHQLERVRREFTGAHAERLEALIEETLGRQLSIDASRAQSLDAATKLAESIQSLKESLTTKKEKVPVIDQGIRAAAHKVRAEKPPNKDLSFVPDVPKVVDKSLN